MSKLTNKELSVMVGAAVAQSMKNGKDKAIHHIVMTRISNALAVEASIAALDAAGSK